MDIPVHVAAAAFTCNATLYFEAKLHVRLNSRERNILIGTFCFLIAALSHLFLDLVPHYDVLYKVDILPAVLFVYIPTGIWKLFIIGILTFPVIAMFWYLTREHPIPMLCAIFGGLYPDFEKGAYFSSLLPRKFVLFPQHSCYFSPDGWESDHIGFLVVSEILLFMALLAGIYWLANKAKQLQKFGETQTTVRSQKMLPGCYARSIDKSNGNGAKGQSISSTFLKEQTFAQCARFYPQTGVGGSMKPSRKTSLKWLTMIYIAGLTSVFLLSDVGWLPQPHELLEQYAPNSVWTEHFSTRLPYDDKIAHFFIMGILSLLVNLSLGMSQISFKNIKCLKGSLLAFAFILLEEGSQMLFPTRSFSWGDLLCGYAGVVCFGQAAIYLMTYKGFLALKLPHVIATIILENSEN